MNEHSKSANILREDSKQVEEASFIARNIRVIGLNVHGVDVSNRLIVDNAKTAFISHRLFSHLFFSTDKRSRILFPFFFVVLQVFLACTIECSR